MEEKIIKITDSATGDVLCDIPYLHIDHFVAGRALQQSTYVGDQMLLRLYYIDAVDRANWTVSTTLNKVYLNGTETELSRLP